MKSGIIYALLAAALFGASTPFAKLLVEQSHPVMLAGLLYLGSGIGLFILMGIRHFYASADNKAAYLKGKDIPWFAGAVFFGGVVGPALLMFGLVYTPGSSAALLLNLEGVFTALLAWFVFRENFDRRIFLGMVSIVAGSVLLSWQQAPEPGGAWSALAIVGACLCWGIDNNLTRKVSASDALQIASIKGLVAGIFNVSLALATGALLPEPTAMFSAALVGFLGYGVSLVLFVLALRYLGTARTGAYFSSAPFVGAALALVMLQETPEILFIAGFAAMALGLWLHLTEKHEHLHSHEPMTHSHSHVHDEHHQHAHNVPWEGSEPHTHEHFHPAMMHKHPHYPDIHHRHEHS
ncbi:MAG: EamA family transporter [Gammaproteobacteria bacterium]|nr:EamA family transporter [Gammaproteobacteria bacterium]